MSSRDRHARCRPARVSVRQAASPACLTTLERSSACPCALLSGSVKNAAMSVQMSMKSEYPESHDFGRRLPALGTVLDRLTFQQARGIAGEARGLADEEFLQPRHAVDEPEPNIADLSERPEVIGEEPVQHVG